MVSNFLKSMYAFLITVPELSTSSGMSISGTIPDPTAVSVETPSAWLVYAGRTPQEKPKNGVVPTTSSYKVMFVVMVYLDNSKGQDHLINNQIPILEKVVQAIAGKEPLDGTAYRFAFEGERLASLNPKRLSYELRFSISCFL